MRDTDLFQQALGLTPVPRQNSIQVNTEAEELRLRQLVLLLPLLPR